MNPTQKIRTMRAAKIRIKKDQMVKDRIPRSDQKTGNLQSMIQPKSRKKRKNIMALKNETRRKIKKKERGALRTVNLRRSRKNQKKKRRRHHRKLSRRQ